MKRAIGDLLNPDPDPSNGNKRMIEILLAWIRDHSNKHQKGKQSPLATMAYYLRKLVK